MKILENKWLKVTVKKSGKGEPFHFKAQYVPHRSSMAEMQWETGDTYKSDTYFIISFLQIFWLWFVVGIEIKKEKIGQQKYVRYEATHFASIDDALSQQ